MNLLLVGMNHRTAPLEVRERFAAAEPKPLLTKLVAHPEIEEAVLISTCNRVEVVALSKQPDAARHVIGGFFHRELGHGEALPRGLHLASLLYEHLDGAAVRHLFRVASSIDSLVVGEPQILGQVKDAYRAAVEVGACGPVLGRLFQRAFGAAKRVRTETQMGERPVSVARVAVDLACQIFDSLADKTALLVGAGDMIEIALEALRSEGLTSILVANRTVRHAEALAGRFEASAHALTELPSLLARSDVVLSCIGGAEPVLDVATVSAALRARGNRPIFLIDIGVPRNVAPDVNRLDNVYLYDQDDLAGVAEANAEERRRETQRAEAIVLEEQQRFDGWLAALEAVPTIRRLRERAESIRAAEVARALRRLSLDPGAREAVEALSRALVNKILHAPISRLREDADRAQGLAHLEAARSLFGLDEGDPVESEPAPDGEPGPDDDPDPR